MMVLDYDIINKEELARALAEILPEYQRFDDVKKCKVVDQIADALGSKSTLSMLFAMVKTKALKG